MRARTCVSVVVFIARKLRPCPSYSRRRDRNNSVHWRSLYKGGAGYKQTGTQTNPGTRFHTTAKVTHLKNKSIVVGLLTLETQIEAWARI